MRDAPDPESPRDLRLDNVFQNLVLIALGDVLVSQPQRAAVRTLVEGLDPGDLAQGLDRGVHRGKKKVQTDDNVFREQGRNPAHAGDSTHQQESTCAQIARRALEDLGVVDLDRLAEEFVTDRNVRLDANELALFRDVLEAHETAPLRSPVIEGISQE